MGSRVDTPPHALPLRTASQLSLLLLECGEDGQESFPFPTMMSELKRRGPGPILSFYKWRKGEQTQRGAVFPGSHSGFPFARTLHIAKYSCLVHPLGAALGSEEEGGLKVTRPPQGQCGSLWPLRAATLSSGCGH